jgi:hypothetical protein
VRVVRVRWSRRSGPDMHMRCLILVTGRGRAGDEATCGNTIAHEDIRTFTAILGRGVVE